MLAFHQGSLTVPSYTPAKLHVSTDIFHVRKTRTASWTVRVGYLICNIVWLTVECGDEPGRPCSRPSLTI